MTGASGTTTTDGFVMKLTFPALALTASTRRIAYGSDALNRLTSASESGGIHRVRPYPLNVRADKPAPIAP